MDSDSPGRAGLFLGIEIGGTKLQLGVGSGGDEHLVGISRHDVDAARGAVGILDEIERSATALMQKHRVERIGIGFGGPVDRAAGVCTKSHQVQGWDGFPLARWCFETFNKPAVMGNDCDVAALAEARLGAGRGAGSVLYVTVGTGIGGGFVIDGKLHGAARPAVAEVGHLRPGLLADRPDMTIESLAAGPGIAAAAVARMTNVSRPLDSLRSGTGPMSRAQVIQRLHDVKQTEEEYIADLLERCDGQLDQMTAKMVAQSASEGNEIARDVVGHAWQALGWGIAQAITLLAPEVVVIGGGVSLIGEQFFFSPLRLEVARYVFPPLAGSYKIVPAKLGELSVVHGAIALAADNG